VSSFYPYSNNRTLIMKIHVNNNHTQGDQITYYAFVEKVYQVRTNPPRARTPSRRLSFSTPWWYHIAGPQLGQRGADSVPEHEGPLLHQLLQRLVRTAQ
jgi:hypothetical protein